MKNIIVTGATSFIGTNLINALLEKDYKIFAVVRPNSKKLGLLPKSEKIQTVELDMNDYKDLCKVIKEPCQIYFSFAWNGTRGKARSDAQLQKSNFEYSMDGFNSALKLGCTKIISAGSQAEYGPQNDVVTEKTVPAPNTEYGKQKLAFYQAASKIASEKNVSFIEPRFFSLYGPHDSEATMVMSMLKKMLNNEDCDLTACTQTWDFLNIKDAVGALAMLCENDSCKGIYNFGNGEFKPLKKFIEIMHSTSGSKSRLNFGKIPYPPTGAVNLKPDSSKLKNELSWKPNIVFSDGIAEIINSFKG